MELHGRVERVAEDTESTNDSHSVLPLPIPCKLLILRASSTWAQGVVGSNPIAPTNLNKDTCPRRPPWPFFKSSSYVWVLNRSAIRARVWHSRSHRGRKPLHL